MTPTLIRLTTLLAAVALAAPSTDLAARTGPAGTRTLFVSVLDESGRPVKDITADDIRMREDGKDVQIVNVGPAQDPLQVVVLVDTSDSATTLTSDIRRAIGSFIKQLHVVRQDTAIELMEFGQAAVANTPFTTDDTVLLKALDKMVGRPGADAVMLEAIQQAATDLAKRPSPRRAVVAFNIDPSRELVNDTGRIKDAYRKSVAQLWSVTLHISNVTYGGGRGATAVATTSSTRNAILTQLSEQTGGEREELNAVAGLEGQLQKYADALTYQYEIVYRSTSKSPKVVQVGTTRQGVKLHASGFAPQ